MKALTCSLIVAALVAAPALGADGISLVGTWTGQRDRIAKSEGRRGGLATLVITEQQGYTFVGHLKRSNPTGDEDEPLWGAFAPDGQLMMGADDEGTYTFPSRRFEHLGLLLQRGRPFCACGMCEAHPAALSTV